MKYWGLKQKKTNRLWEMLKRAWENTFPLSLSLFFLPFLWKATWVSIRLLSVCVWQVSAKQCSARHLFSTLLQPVFYNFEINWFIFALKCSNKKTKLGRTFVKTIQTFLEPREVKESYLNWHFTVRKLWFNTFYWKNCCPVFHVTIW